MSFTSVKKPCLVKEAALSKASMGGWYGIPWVGFLHNALICTTFILLSNIV